MIADVILGNTVDTNMWIDKLIKNKAGNIIVLDYDEIRDIKLRKDVVFLNPLNVKEYLKKFDRVNYYKSLYVYPGMNGKMSDLYKK